MEEGCMKKLAIIPAYNEMGNIEKTVNDIRENAKSFDYIVIDDCSTDDTAKICEEQGFSFISLPTISGSAAVYRRDIFTRSNMAMRLRFSLTGMDSTMHLISKKWRNT